MTKTQPFLIVLLLSVRLRLFTSLVFVGWKYYPWDGNDTGLFANPSRGCQLRAEGEGGAACGTAALSTEDCFQGLHREGVWKRKARVSLKQVTANYFFYYHLDYLSHLSVWRPFPELPWKVPERRRMWKRRQCRPRCGRVASATHTARV